ncbi:hypothetical protein HZB93_03970 [Candidatus Falkowbacteria bacterium]|nr:hypothetical protein [Candidatus Falkowbacteria bacterium]
MSIENPFNNPTPPQEQTPKPKPETVEQAERKEELPNLGERLTEAEATMRRYEELTREVRNTGKTSDPEYSQKREAAQKELSDLSKEFADRFGVNLNDTWVSDGEVFNKGRESVLLGKAVGIAREAQEMSFDKNLDDNGLVEEAKRLIEDYQIYTEPVVRTGQSPDKNYSSRREAKQLLVESIARELAKRLNVGDGIEVNSIKALSEKTGVDFSKAVRKVERVYRAPTSKKEQESRGRLPQMGASGTWKTPGGYVSGKVISGRPGGPYTIETPQGRIQVDKID